MMFTLFSFMTTLPSNAGFAKSHFEHNAGPNENFGYQVPTFNRAPWRLQTDPISNRSASRR